MQRAFLTTNGTVALHHVDDVGVDFKYESATVARAGVRWHGLLLRISSGFFLQ